MGIIICTKCLNWSGSDCELNHTVYRTRLGAYVTDQCDDFESVDSEKSIEDFVNSVAPDETATFDEESESEYEPEPEYEEPEYEEPEPPRYPPRKNKIHTEHRHFTDDVKDRIRRAKERPLREEREHSLPPTEKYNPSNDDDPLEELRREMGSANPLSDLYQFANDVKSGKIDGRKIAEELKNLRYDNSDDYKINEKDLEAEREELRRRLNIHGLNEAYKKKQEKEKTKNEKK